MSFLPRRFILWVLNCGCYARCELFFFWIWGVGCPWCLRARARVLPPWCQGARFRLLELGTHFRLPGSTLQVVREHASGCPGAHVRWPGSRLQVVREHNLALPGFGCPGARFRLQEHASVFRLPGSTFQVAREHNLALPGFGCLGARFNGHGK